MSAAGGEERASWPSEDGSSRCPSQGLRDAALAADHDFLQAIIEQTAGGLCVCHDVPDPPFVRFTVWNEQMTSLTGYTKEEINRKGWYQSLYPDPAVQERARGRMERMRHGDNLRGEEWRITRADGRERMLRINTSLLRTPDGIPHVLALIADVTEDWQARKGLETAHRDTEQRLRSILDHADALVWAIAGDGTITLSEGRGLRTLGLQPGQVVGKNLFDLYRENPAAVEAARKALTGEDSTGVVEVDGQLFDVRYTPSGETGGAIGVALNVTERMRARRKLEEEKERARSYLDIAKTMLVSIAADERVTLINRKGCEVLGCTADEVVGTNWFDRFLPERDRDRVRSVFRQLLLEDLEPVEEFENEVLTRSGGERTIAWRNALLRDGDGRIVGTLSSGEDITERRRAEAALRESEERFREMAANINEVFWLFDWVEQRVLYASPAFESIWGRSLEDLYGNYDEWATSVHPEDRAYAEESFARSVETGGGEAREYRIVRPDGQVRWVSDRAFAIRDDDGNVTRIAGVAEDITARKQDEEENRRLQAKMQHAQKLESLGVMAGGIAHDFNNLLMAILGNADLALTRLAPESPGRDFIERVEKAAQRAADLTNQMLAYSGRGTFLVRPIQLDRLVGEMAHLLRTVISKKVDLRILPTRDLPAVEADATQIRQVVMNLITNASESLVDGSGIVCVSTGEIVADRAYLDECHLGDERPEGPYVYVEVSDTGSGMDGETLDKIFDPFFTTKFTGRGLGLAAVLGIVRSHFGAVRVDSAPGRGSTFRVLFTPGAKQAEPRDSGPGLRESRRAGGTVLAVDDDPAVLELAVMMLEDSGFRVLCAPDGEVGVDVLRQHGDEIDVILLDMTMPRMDGAEAFREMRRIRPDVRVILSSGYTEQEAAERFTVRGLAGFIQKPYRMAQLAKTVRDVLDDT